MKKLLIKAALLFLFCNAVIFSADISAIGYGDDEVSARDDARSALLDYVFGTYVYSHSFLYEKDDPIDDSIYEMKAFLTTGGNLLAVDYDSKPNITNIKNSQSPLKFICTATIKTNSIGVYYDEIERQKELALYLESYSALNNNYVLSYNYFKSLKKLCDYYIIVSLLDDKKEIDKSFILSLQKKMTNSLINSITLLEKKRNEIEEALSKANEGSQTYTLHEKELVTINNFYLDVLNASF